MIDKIIGIMVFISWITSLIIIIYCAFCMFKIIFNLNKDKSKTEKKPLILFSNEAFNKTGNKYRIRFIKLSVVFIFLGIFMLFLIIYLNS